MALGDFMRRIQVPSVPSSFILVYIRFQPPRPLYDRSDETGRQEDSKIL